jgi:hypothetical protein
MTITVYEDEAGYGARNDRSDEEASGPGIRAPEVEENSPKGRSCQDAPDRSGYGAAIDRG